MYIPGDLPCEQGRDPTGRGVRKKKNHKLTSYKKQDKFSPGKSRRDFMQNLR